MQVINFERFVPLYADWNIEIVRNDDYHNLIHYVAFFHSYTVERVYYFYYGS